MASESSGHDASASIWAAVFVIIAGTIVGGIGLIEWNWIAFWIGIGLTVGGSIWAWLAGIMESVSEFGSPAESG
ncbi:MAG TPA: hypothetical protein VHD58_09040 [Mycobacteriales bacterium]|jgi:hypothetical protein|nr:hypothetical protein [Mycobacteriales bacterium]